MSAMGISDKRDTHWKGPLFLRKNVWRRMLLEITFQLNDLVQLNMPLDKGISTMTVDVPNRKLRGLLMVVADDIGNGLSLHEALARRPNFFPAPYVTAIRVGEETGRLPEVLDHLEENLVESGRFHADLMGHLFYIKALFLFVFFIGMLLSIFVLPQFAAIFGSFDRVLPLTTTGLINLSREQWFFPSIIAVVLLLLYLESKLAFLSRQQGWISGVLWKLVDCIPFLNRVYHCRDLAQTARQLATLTWAGIPLDKAVGDAATSDINPAMAAALERTAKRISNGLSFTESIKEESPSLFPERFSSMVALGEQAGTLPAMLEQLTQVYKSETLHRARMLMNLGAPLGVCCIGAYVFLFCYSLMGPISNLSSLVMR
jgi:type II secretory pathway component PulF